MIPRVGRWIAALLLYAYRSLALLFALLSLAFLAFGDPRWLNYLIVFAALVLPWAAAHWLRKARYFSA